MKGVTNKKLIRKLADANKPIGIIAFEGTNPVGWCSVSPREDFIRLENSRVLKRVDNKKPWSIVCLFINKSYRRMGLSVNLIKAAVKFAMEKGAEIVEAYPVIPKKEDMPDVFAFTGIHSAYVKAGFKEVARRSETRPIMRFDPSSVQS
jgi:GNAT superfamily N-acetyltransferase